VAVKLGLCVKDLGAKRLEARAGPNFEWQQALLGGEVEAALALFEEDLPVRLDEEVA